MFKALSTVGVAGAANEGSHCGVRMKGVQSGGKFSIDINGFGIFTLKKGKIDVNMLVTSASQAMPLLRPCS